MTTPTQAQIEAAVKAIQDAVGGRSEVMTDLWCDVAKAALTAAANVEWARENLRQVGQENCGYDPLTKARIIELEEEIEQLEKSAAFVSRTEWKENKQLKALNAELVVALKAIIKLNPITGRLEQPQTTIARAALAKVKEGK